MRRLFFGILGLLPALAAGVGEQVEAAAIPAAGESYAGKVVVIDIEGRDMADLRKFQDWAAILTRVEDEKAQAVVLRIDSSGGYADEAMKLMEQIAALTPPSYAFVKKEGLGSSSLLAVSTKGIYLAPEAMIGGAGSVALNQEFDGRLESLLLAKIRSVVSKQGHDIDLVRAMVRSSDEETKVGEVVIPKGSILTLTAKEATASSGGRPALARGIVKDVKELLEKEGLSDAEVVTGSAKPQAASKTIPLSERQGVKREAGEDAIGLKAKEEAFTDKIVVLRVGETDLINEQSFKFWRRMLRRAEDEKAAAVIFELDTPGGYAFKTKEIMTEITRLKVPCFAFVNEDALSAGALISVATDGIYMNPDAVIGAAGLVSGGGEIEEMMRKKLHSVFEAHVRGVAEKKGYDAELIRAMMIPDELKDRVFGDVVVKKGELLTLTASEAVSLRNGKPLLARGIVTSLEELAEREGLAAFPIVRAEPTPFENFAWWVARFSPVLILIGIGAAYAEMKAPGFGIAGAISLAVFGVFFFGNYVAGNLAGYEMFALFMLGVILIAVEIFVIPGTGITGLAGAACIVGALLFGMVDEIDFGDWKGGEFEGGFVELLSGPALNLGLGLIGAVILVMLLMRYLPRVPLFNALTLQKELAGGASIRDAEEKKEDRVGWTGESLTDLRPAGKVQFTDQVLDVVADGGFIEKGAQVRILKEDGMRVVVQKI